LVACSFNEFIFTFPGILVTYTGFGTIVLICFSNSVIAPNSIKQVALFKFSRGIVWGKTDGQK
jgi:hypothetical protein